MMNDAQSKKSLHIVTATYKRLLAASLKLDTYEN